MVDNNDGVVTHKVLHSLQQWVPLKQQCVKAAWPFPFPCKKAIPRRNSTAVSVSFNVAMSPSQSSREPTVAISAGVQCWSEFDERHRRSYNYNFICVGHPPL